MTEIKGSIISPNPEFAHICRQLGHGVYLFRSARVEPDGLRETVVRARNLSPALWTVDNRQAQMWGEFQIGELQHSIESANAVLNLAEEGSGEYMCALSCKLYLQVELGQITEAAQTLQVYREVSRARLAA